MKKKLNTNGTLEALLVIGLILIIPLFFVMRTAAEQTPAPIAPTAALPTAVNIPAQPTVENAPDDSSNALAPKQPPACTFPLAEITTQESTPEEYIFSEPKVILTAPQGNSYNIAGWLPDNQQILITEDLRNSYVESNDNAPQQSISLYNPETGESKVYATRTENHEPPIWQSELNGVVYSVMNYASIDKKNGAYKFTRQLWVSYGNPDATQLLADNLPQLPFASKPDGSETLYLSDKKISKLDKSLKKLSSAFFYPAQWDYGKGWRNKNTISYKMAWQPGTSLVFLYSMSGGSSEGGYTFILDTDTGHVCELNMGGWAGVAHWSLNGRYLAIIRSEVYSGFANSTDLVVLDTTNGNLYTVEVISQDMQSQHYVDDFAWMSDNHHLLALGHASMQNANQNGSVHHDLRLVDFTSNQNIHLFPEFKSFFANGAPWNNFALSPDGSKILIRCPANGTDRICLVSVQKTAQ